ncbi:ABC transporter permease [Ramlibacter henchirensis]|uniref:ABC transporter permease n=1 Tax=Ramlibacter henchirensis TaxID=204072 RepID=A0A4Z0BX97_9BURK|nr:ABC transporter permease [Ramlibacter henchirensis]TFZ02599.1 ABC transporter permease [Ramlibacter henchirensis]
MKRDRDYRIWGFGLVAALLVLWELSARTWVASPNWPPVSQILVAGKEAFTSGELPMVFLSSLGRMAAGFVAGGLLGIVVGLLMGRLRWVNAALDMLVELVRPIPIPAIVPPLILLLGIDTSMKVFIVAFATFFPVLVNTIAGVRSVERTALDVARTFQVPPSRTLVRVVLPASMPFILVGLRTSLALALIVTVIAEMIAGSEGIGYYLMTMQFAMRAGEMYAAILLLAIVGYVLNLGMLRMERRVLHWFQRAAD